MELDFPSVSAIKTKLIFIFKFISTVCMCAYDVFGECRCHGMCVEIETEFCEMSYKASGHGTLVPGLVQASAFTC